jgi:undecaprenyl-diphosphatase
MDEILRAIILGIVQGVTEWLPVSSSGHLVIFQNIFGIKESDVLFDVMLHFGSLLVIFFVFRKDLRELARGVIRLEQYYLNRLLLKAIGSVPIMLAGFFLNSLIKSIFSSLITVGISLLLTALLLFLSGFSPKRKRSLGLIDSLVIGISQALALLPGVSRSGATISTGMILGIDRQEAARFSFILVIPAILGAVLLELTAIKTVPALAPIIIGTVFSIITGFLSLRLLLFIVQKNRLSIFSWYCATVGLVLLVISFT